MEVMEEELELEARHWKLAVTGQTGNWKLKALQARGFGIEWNWKTSRGWTDGCWRLEFEGQMTG